MGRLIYDIDCFCDGWAIPIKRIWRSLPEKRPMRQTKDNVGNIPAIPTPDYCVVRNKSHPHYPNCPFVTKTFTLTNGNQSLLS